MSTFQAVLCEKHGPPSSLILKDLPSLTGPLSDNQVLISVHACGVNFPDTLIIQGKYQTQPPLPFAPGSEIAGIVKKVGAGVKGLRVGQRVAVSTGWGGFVEEAVVDAKKVMVLPDSMDLVTASAFTMTYGTSYHALKDRANLKPGETVLVLGASGGVGIAAVELAKIMGAKVIACASSVDKLETCKKYGADVLIDYSQPNWDQQIKQAFKNGVDVIYDPVGGEYAEKAIRLMAWEGRYLVVGFASGPIPAIKLNLLLLKGCSAVGVFLGRFAATQPEKYAAEIRQLAQWQVEGKIKPLVSAIYPLSSATRALEDLLNRKVQGKVVLTTRNYKKDSARL